MSDETGKEQHGSCLCESVRYTVTAAPVAAMACHCSHCQKQTGSAFSTIAGVPEAAFSLEGEAATYVDHGDSGNTVERSFCLQCGSPLFTRAEAAPGLVWIKTGTLDNPDAFAPSMHIWCKSKQHWLEPGALPAFDVMPG
ncbi:GFA family protein [Qipengyuania sp. CAU 1752]